VGTDNFHADKHSLIFFDPEIMIGDADEKRDPIKHIINLSEHVRDVQWIQPRTLVTALGNHVLQVWNAHDTRDSFEFDFKIETEVKSIREVAVNPFAIHQIATGGDDQKVVFVDLNSKQVKHFELGDIVSSVKWTSFAGSCVSCTLETSCKLLIYDVSESGLSPSMTINAKKSEPCAQMIYTHEIYMRNVLIGDNSGHLYLYDLRKPDKLLQEVEDPYCEAIGNIRYNRNFSSFVTSGLCNFTVWKHELAVDNEARFWVRAHQHQSSAIRLYDQDFMTNATYISGDQIVVACSQGRIAIISSK